MAGQSAGKTKYSETNNYPQGRKGGKSMTKNGPATGRRGTVNPTKKGKIAGNNGR